MKRKTKGYYIGYSSALGRSLSILLRIAERLESDGSCPVFQSFVNYHIEEIRGAIVLAELKAEKMEMKVNEFWEDIEEPIRDVVRLLRDNGFNTTSSCGHKMYIELGEFGRHMEGVEQIASLLWDNGYKTFKIECTLRVPQTDFGHVV